jgi:tRNA nucleotidyltransferase (CCA-adding enzyme)
MHYPDAAMRLAPEATLRSDRLVVEVWNEMGRPPCFLAGGYLRDRLLGRPSTDLDFSLPGDVERAATAAHRLGRARGTRPHLLGRAPRAVWRVDSRGLKVELWPLGSLTIDDDILRRDFTCNALVWQVPDGPLIDQVGGLDDLRMGRLRAVSRRNLEDDPLRLLRAARFLAQLDGLELDRRTTSFIRELAPALARAPRARVGNELRLLLAAGGAERGLRSLLRLGTFRHAAPPGASPDPAWMKAHTGAVGRLAGSRRHPVPAAVREAGVAASLALLLHGWGCPADEGLAEYSWPREERMAAGRVARLLDRAIAGVGLDAAGRREIIHAAGADFPVLLAAAAAAGGGGRPAAPGWRRWWAQWRRQGERLVSPPELLSFDELAARSGLPPGPGAGRLLRRLRLAQVRGTVRSASGARRWIAAAAGGTCPGEGGP